MLQERVVLSDFLLLITMSLLLMVNILITDNVVFGQIGDPVSSDISHDQVSDLYFTDGTRDRSFSITILSDNIPEITEVRELG